MKKADYNYILYTVSRHNVLPITSACNFNCLFCSHEQNPPGIEVFTLPHFSLDEYRDIIEFLDPSKKVVIGESSTRIIEGEPFCSKDIMHILKMVRERLPQTPITITTNGCLLREETIKDLKAIMPLEINLSINYTTPGIRERMLGDRHGCTAVEAIELLHKHQVPYNGSAVAMAFYMWEEELQRTAMLLEGAGAGTFRVFYPGYSKYGEDVFPRPDYMQLKEIIDDLKSRCSMPIIMEPPIIEDFNATVEGIIKGSPAFKAGITAGDVISRVNGEQVASRVDAFNRVLKASRPEIEIIRDGQKLTVLLDKEKGQTSGLVFNYDIDPGYMDNVIKVIKRYRSRSPLLVTSGMAFPLIMRYFKEAGEGHSLEIIKITNRYFGGNIDCAGLMVVEDIISSVAAETDYSDRDLLLLPSIAFDHRGRDITGMHYSQIENALGMRVEVV